jgi:nitroreductase
MNPKLQSIFSRRSIRVYQNRGIDREIVRDLLEAAMAAPSAVAKDPWEFIVLTDKKRLATVAEALPNGKMLTDAPLGIIVCGDMQRAHSGELSYLIQDCSAAIQNLLLAASMLGLGACWLGVHPRPDRIAHIRKVFDLPESVLPIAAIAIGYPAETKEPRTRYNLDYVHNESW